MRFALLTLLFFFSIPSIQAQDVLLNDAQRPVVVHAAQSSKKPQPHTAKVSGVTAAAPFPFWDDFSYDSLAPSMQNWAVAPEGLFARVHVPGVSVRKGIDPPSKGVCTFDGATFAGNLHEDELSFGMGDSLTSNSFDFSAFNAADSLHLSFFVQRGGFSDAPESTDSLILYFDSTGNYEYVRVWGIGGTGTAEGNFLAFSLPITGSQFFHSNFRFKFANFGSRNGEFDVWHLDYVQLDSGRSVSETIPADLSPALVEISPLSPWTGIPFDHFVQRTWGATPSVQIMNAGSPTLSGNVSMMISDPVGGNTLGGTVALSVSSLSIPANSGVSAIPSAGFSDQSGSMGSYGAIQMRTIVSSGSDAYHGNDTLDFLCGIDSVIAFDDGVSDAAYGQTVPRAFCQEYRIPSPDTLTAVWIYFSPYLHYNPANGQSTSLQDKSFRLGVWDTLVVDSFLLQTSTGMLVRYDSSLNSFNRYPLNNPLVVDTLFWLGIRQVDNMPIGVGFDRNLHHSPIYYEASSGEFVLSSNQGTLMIRPEFARKRVITAAQAPEDKPFQRMSLGPNPWIAGDLIIRLQGMPVQKGGLIRIFGMDGRELYSSEWPAASEIMRLERSLLPANGLYLVQFEGKTQAGKPLLLTQKLVAH